MSSGVKITLIIVGAIVLLGITCIGGCFGFAIWAGTRPPPEGIVVTIDRPDDITVGDSFDFVVTITNEQSEPRQLMDIDFNMPLLDGVTVGPVDPLYEASLDMGLLYTYTFNEEIPANGDLVVTFNMTADAPGFYAGSVDVSVDSAFSVLPTAASIDIARATEGP